ncbi:hypothetical protein AZOA_25050 [Azoarcus sp. Aa7]|nr:hypothetical protein [Azoarcus sp. Aa7]
MNDREYLGMNFTWDRWLRLPAWIKESWPITAPALLAMIHFVVVFRIGLSAEDVVWFNKWSSAILQVVGGGLVLLSIDSNIRLFDRDSLKARVRAYFQRLPFCCWRHTLTPESAHLSLSGGTPTVRFRSCDNTLEGRVKQLEADLTFLQQELTQTASVLRMEMQKASENFILKLEDVKTTTSRMELGLKQMTGSGVGQQVFGVFLVFHGAVAGIFT